MNSRFILESVLDLKKSLLQLGGDLLVVPGKPEIIIEQLIIHLNSLSVPVSSIVCQKEV